MKVKLFGKNLEDLRPLLPAFGMEEAEQGYELVLTHGGDGALLGAEREFPGVPKLPLRDAATAPTCPEHELRKRLEKFCSGQGTLRKLPLLEGRCGEVCLHAVNDILLHNADPRSALRYRVRIDGKLYAEEVIGDGIVFASVHGSSAYYRCITHSIFHVGLGVAFSNSMEEIDHLVLPEDSVVEAEVIRGPGLLIADNGPEMPLVPVGSRVLLRQAPVSATVWDLEDFMCPRCRQLRHPGKFVVPGNGR